MNDSTPKKSIFDEEDIPNVAEDTLEWLESVKQITMSEAYRDNLPNLENDLAVFNARLNKVSTLIEFLKLEEEMIRKCTMSFSTDIDDKKVILKSAVILLSQQEIESRKNIEHCMKEKDPDRVVRYRVYDHKYFRIRGRRCRMESLQKVLQVVPYKWDDHKQYLDDIIEALQAKIKQVEAKSNDDKFKKSMLERAQQRLNRAMSLKK